MASRSGDRPASASSILGSGQHNAFIGTKPNDVAAFHIAPIKMRRDQDCVLIFRLAEYLRLVRKIKCDRDPAARMEAAIGEHAADGFSLYVHPDGERRLTPPQFDQRSIEREHRARVRALRLNVDVPVV